MTNLIARVKVDSLYLDEALVIGYIKGKEFITEPFGAKIATKYILKVMTYEEFEANSKTLKRKVSPKRKAAKPAGKVTKRKGGVAPRD